MTPASRKIYKEIQKKHRASWQSAAIAVVCAYLFEHRPGWRFVSADIVVFAHRRRLPRPRDNRSWGPVIQRFVDHEIIRRVGTKKAFWRRGARTALWMKC